MCHCRATRPSGCTLVTSTVAPGLILSMEGLQDATGNNCLSYVLKQDDFTCNKLKKAMVEVKKTEREGIEDTLTLAENLFEDTVTKEKKTVSHN